MFTVVFPYIYMQAEVANIHATVMDEEDFDGFLINKINNSVITVMTFHLLLLKQDIITLLFSHLKQVLSS